MSQQFVTIITPCYNESIYVLRFLDELEVVLRALPYRFCVVVVNDGSTDDTLTLMRQYRFTARNICLDVLNLSCNAGHQQAIYQGMLYARGLDSRHFIVMDSDGEDAPAVIPELLKQRGADIVNVVRGKRKERLLYQLGYKLYKITFRMMTGRQMNFGNFCLISRRVLEHATDTSFTHFPAFLARQQFATIRICADKQERIGGQSKMGIKELCNHAIKSFAEFGEELPKILLKRFLVVMAAIVTSAGIIAYQQFVAQKIIPTWLSLTILALVNLAVIAIGLFAIGLALQRKNKYLHPQNAIYELCPKEDTRELIQA